MYNLTPSKLLFAGAVLFGSRALGVNEEDADYDFAIYYNNFKNLVDGKHPEFPIKDYFTVIPNGKAFLVRIVEFEADIDIVVLRDINDLTTIKRSIDELKNIDSRKLKHKKFRVKEYEKALLRNGFKLSNRAKIKRTFLWLQKYWKKLKN